MIKIGLKYDESTVWYGNFFYVFYCLYTFTVSCLVHVFVCVSAATMVWVIGGMADKSNDKKSDKKLDKRGNKSSGRDEDLPKQRPQKAKSPPGTYTCTMLCSHIKFLINTINRYYDLLLKVVYTISSKTHEEDCLVPIFINFIVRAVLMAKQHCGVFS